jgi:hypothetical protein
MLTERKGYVPDGVSRHSKRFEPGYPNSKKAINLLGLGNKKRPFSITHRSDTKEKEDEKSYSPHLSDYGTMRLDYESASHP